ncbi:diacylglycerol kinase family protein [Phenylobacterium sp.]|uniref:diacylglycerol/lipid kinase family protein n=1 Tax=Phenylobacterium sp. TaxID=1871053 RepID=UPI0025F46475|nr:diacylglycerol kinase family protein [Phenylobacterium sp.]
MEVVVNVASGSVGSNAPAELEKLLGEFGVTARVRTPQPGQLIDQLKAAVDAGPDLLITLAGDGTVRAAAELCGPDGPMLAPLPGGTMNMMPHAVYGQRSWQDALRVALEDGRERDLGGGCIDGHRFLCAAILGSPARLASAREAARSGNLIEAFGKVRHAVQRAFTGRLRYQLDGHGRSKAEALVLMCPIASKVMHAEDPALEAAALNPSGAGEILRLGLNALVRDWRVDPSVEDQFCRRAHVWAAQGIPALLDGEIVRLPSVVDVRYDPKVCRVLTPPKDER